MHFVDNWQQASAELEKMLHDDKPMFLSRVGGSDTNAVAKYLSLKESKTLDVKHSELSWHKRRASEYNGFYDKSANPETFIRYCELLLECYKTSTRLFMCNASLLSIYFPTTIHKEMLLTKIDNETDLSALIAHIAQAPQKTFYFYQLIEHLISNSWTLFSLFSTVLTNKKVLVVSPFSESIKGNFHNRKGFFKNYSYPEFELLTLNTPITYSGLPIELYPHADWFETLQALQVEMSQLDFDIALLSCGSYAMPLGVYAEQSMRKKAVYVGGVLQLFFGVMGRRYEGPFVTQQINAEKFVYPVERNIYLKDAKFGPEIPKEALGAYF